MIDWGTLVAEATIEADLTESDRVVAVAAFNELRAMLGEDLFSHGHPLGFLWLNRAPWVRRWTAWLLDTLQRFQNEPWFGRLIDDLRNPATCSERLVVLDVAARLTSGGFFIEMDPTVLIDNAPKKPDLLVLFEQEPAFYIEVSDLYTSDKERVADQAFSEIGDVIRTEFPDAWATWHLKRSLAPAHLAEIIHQVRATMAKARSLSTLQTLDREGIFTMAAAPPSLQQELDAWSQEHGLELREGRGPEVDINVMDRLAFKLKREQEQLPKKHSNVVLINAPFYWSRVGSESFFRELTHSFEEEAFRFPHVAYVVLVCHWSGDNTNGDYRSGDHLCLNRQDFDMICRSSVLLRNRFAEPLMTPRSEGALLSCIG